MANILITYYSDYGEVMYEAISKVLLKNGNNIFRLNINATEVYITGWGKESHIISLDLLDKIKNFNPDIIFNFNNSMPSNCLDVINNSCKICIIDADNPETFWNQELLKKNSNKYYYLGLQSYSKNMYEKALGKTLQENANYLYFPPATIVKKEKLIQDKNITFIGSNFYPYSIPTGYHFYNENALRLYKHFKKNYFLTIEDAQKLCPDVENINWLYENVRAFNAGQERIKYLQALTDLGLTFYGSRHWEQINYIDLELGSCHDETKILTLEENQWVYNTSKISINISHPQAISSFSWRVMDIMASGACLLMEDKKDWKDLFKKHLSKETLDLVIYKDRFDMRDKAKILLNDEKLRQKCVAELNYAIEQNGRWENRFAKLSEFLKINLLNLENKNPIFIKNSKDAVIDPFNSTQLENKNLLSLFKNLFKALKIKKRCKQIFYLSILILAQIPILDLLIHRKQRTKIKQKIDKYWR